jgi:adenylate cyclase
MKLNPVETAMPRPVLMVSLRGHPACLRLRRGVDELHRDLPKHLPNPPHSRYLFGQRRADRPYRGGLSGCDGSVPRDRLGVSGWVTVVETDASSGSAEHRVVLKRLVDRGVEQAESVAETRWVRTLNVVALAALALSSLFALFYGVLDLGSLWPVVVTNIIWNCGYGLVIVINGRGRTRLASWVLLFTGWANTLAPAVFLGAGTGVYLFLVLIPMIGVLISGPRDRVMPVVVIGFGVVAFAIVPMMFTESPPVMRGTMVEKALFASSAIGVGAFGSLFALYYRWLVALAEEALAAANARSERLLLNILPEPIAERLKAEESPIADRIDEVTVLFADLVGSTPLAQLLSADDLVALLDRIFSQFDDLSERFGLEKVATIGDGYMAVSGLPVGRPDHMAVAADMALAMRDSLGEYFVPGFGHLGMRFGLASGSVVAGVIGKRKFRFDLWGDTVNTASRMESHGEPGMIHVTSDIQRALADTYEFQPRGEILIKGKGPMETYFLISSRQSPTVRDAGPPSQAVPAKGSAETPVLAEWTGHDNVL